MISEAINQGLQGYARALWRGGILSQVHNKEPNLTFVKETVSYHISYNSGKI